MCSAKYVDCRACAKSQEITNMIYLYKDDNMPAMYCVCTSVEVKENDSLPAHICTDCNGQLIHFYEFRKRCLAADTLHRDRLIVKTEITFNEFPKEEISLENDTIKRERTEDYSIHPIESYDDDDDHFGETNSTSNGESETVESSKQMKIDVEANNEEQNKYYRTRACANNKQNKFYKVVPSEEIKITKKNKAKKQTKQRSTTTGSTEAKEEEQKQSENISVQKDEKLQETQDYGDDQVYEAENEPLDRQECIMCNRIFHKTHQMLAHIREHQGLVPFECRVCKKAYKGWSNLKDHIMKTHSTNRTRNMLTFACEYSGCDKRYASKQKRTEHVTKFHKKTQPVTNTTIDKLVKAEKYVCDICGKVCYVKQRMIGHLRQHVGLKAFECVPCGKSFQKYATFKSHNEINHSDTEFKKLKCDFEGCDRTYNLDSTLKHHYEVAHLGKKRSVSLEQICEQCGRSFKNGFQLREHSFVHLGYQHYPFACKNCPKKFVSKYRLKIHQYRHDDIRQYICPVCGLRKTTNAELKIHLNYHTKEKTYPCEQCPAVFSSYNNISRHIRIVHRGYKPYKCTYCERSFSKAETLKHHTMTHTGEKPHACTICDRRFIQVIALKTHMKTHNKQK